MKFSLLSNQQVC